MFEIKLKELVTLALLSSVALTACGDPEDQSVRTTRESPESLPAVVADEDSSSDRENPTRPLTETPDSGHVLGEPLDHPEHYYGLYANPNTPTRQWFVAEAKRPKYAEQAPEVPPGYLAIGAMFGDVAPWHMRTLSDTEFEQAWADHSPDPAIVEFELGDDGNAVAMAFTNDQLASEGRLVRQGDLPEGWE